MPASIERPWSTQYKQDYHGRKQKNYKVLLAKKPNTAYGLNKRTTAATKISISAFNGPRNSELEERYDRQLLLESNELKENFTQERLVSPIDTNVLGQATKVVLPEKEPVISEPIQLRTNTPPPKNLHWSCWPQPIPKEKKRPSTSLGFYRSVKEETDKKTAKTSACNAVIENPIYPSTAPSRDKQHYQQHVGLLVGELLVTRDTIEKGPPEVKYPEFYEENLLNEYQISPREDKMMSVKRHHTFYYEPLQTPRMTSISVNDPPARDTYTMYNNQPKRPQSVSPFGQNNQAFFPYHKPGGMTAREDKLTNSFAKAMEGRQSLPNNYQYSFHKYPFTSRQPSKKAALGDEYVHQHSMFMLTTPRCTGHFIIHPDWVSEKGGIRRSKSFIQMKKDGLRY